MTTSQHKAQILVAIADTRDVLSQAAAEGRVLRAEVPTWREQALERAGELAMSGYLAESRRMAEAAREGN